MSEHTTIYDEYQLLEDRYAALVEAVNEFTAKPRERWHDLGEYISYYKVDVTEIDALAAAQEDTHEPRRIR